jgi:hypothetical protein
MDLIFQSELHFQIVFCNGQTVWPNAVRSLAVIDTVALIGERSGGQIQKQMRYGVWIHRTALINP